MTGRARGTVLIDVERCKGCQLCIPACRPGVLSMSDQRNHMGYAFPVLEDGCTACRACRDVCPDYCFEVYRYDADPDAPASRVPAAGERD